MDQLNALDVEQKRLMALEKTKDEKERAAKQAEKRRLGKIAAERRKRASRLEAKTMEAREAEKKAREAERLLDKDRVQAQEDEDREYVKKQSELELMKKQLEIQKAKAKANLESAIASDRIKSVAEETALLRKKETVAIDAVQAGSDVSRTVAEGTKSMMSGAGSEGLYKFLVVLFLTILVFSVLIVLWYFRNRKA